MCIIKQTGNIRGFAIRPAVFSYAGGYISTVDDLRIFVEAVLDFY
jgi:hypothetical protein